MARRPARPPKPSRVGRRADTFPLLPRPPAYVRQWFRVEEWATFAGLDVGWDPADAPSPRSERVERRRSMPAGLDLHDDEEAERVGIELAAVSIPPGPDQAAGGRRRVVVRLYTWVVDQAAGVVYDGQWLTSGEAMSARAAAAAHGRYIRSYADAVSKGIESRRLVATAMEILWWTTSPGAKYV